MLAPPRPCRKPSPASMKSDSTAPFYSAANSPSLARENAGYYPGTASLSPLPSITYKIEFQNPGNLKTNHFSHLSHTSPPIIIRHGTAPQKMVPVIRARFPCRHRRRPTPRGYTRQFNFGRPNFRCYCRCESKGEHHVCLMKMCDLPKYENRWWAVSCHKPAPESALKKAQPSAPAKKRTRNFLNAKR